MNNLALVTQEDPNEVRLRSTAHELCDAAENVMIMTRADLSHATDLVKAIKNRAKEIEDERTRLVKPFNEGVKAINSRFKAMTVPLMEAEESVKGRMLIFQKEEEKRAQEEAAKQEKSRLEAAEKRRKEEEALAKNSTTERPLAPPAALEPIAPVVSQHRPTTYGQTGAVSTVKKQWAFELVDIIALAQARPDLVQVDTVKVNQEIRGRGGDISGLRIYEKEIMQVR